MQITFAEEAGAGPAAVCEGVTCKALVKTVKGVPMQMKVRFHFVRPGFWACDKCNLEIALKLSQHMATNGGEYTIPEDRALIVLIGLRYGFTAQFVAAHRADLTDFLSAAHLAVSDGPWSRLQTLYMKVNDYEDPKTSPAELAAIESYFNKLDGHFSSSSAAGGRSSGDNGDAGEKYGISLDHDFDGSFAEVLKVAAARHKKLSAGISVGGTGIAKATNRFFVAAAAASSGTPAASAAGGGAGSGSAAVYSRAGGGRNPSAAAGHLNQTFSSREKSATTALSGDVVSAAAASMSTAAHTAALNASAKRLIDFNAQLDTFTAQYQSADDDFLKGLAKSRIMQLQKLIESETAAHMSLSRGKLAPMVAAAAGAAAGAQPAAVPAAGDSVEDATESAYHAMSQQPAVADDAGYGGEPGNP